MKLQVAFVNLQLLRPLLYLFFLNLVCSELHGQNSGYESILGKTYGERQLFLFRNFYSNDELRSDSVRFFQEICKLSEVAEKANDEELLLETEFMRFNYLSSRNYPDYLPEIKIFLEKVDGAHSLQLQARTRQAIGLHYFYEQNNYGQAYIYLNDSYKYLQKLSLQELPDKQELLYNIGYVNYAIGYETKALKFLNEAELLSNNYYETLECNIINTRGLIYQQEGNVKMAINDFRIVFKLAKSIENNLWMLVARNNMANVLIHQKKYEEALLLLGILPGVNPYASDEAGDATSQRFVLLGKVYVGKGDWEKLSLVSEELQRLLQETKIKLHVKKEIYRLLAKNEEIKGNFRQAYFYKDSALNLAEDYFKMKNDQGLKQTLEKERIKNLLNEQLKAEHKQRVMLVSWVSLVVILLLIIALSIVIFIRQKEKFKKNEFEVKFELNESRNKLAELLVELKSRDKQIRVFEKELQKLHKNTHKGTDEITEKQQTLQELLSKPIMTEEKWRAFKRAFDNVYPDYCDKLQAKIPNISPAEIRYMYFRKLNLAPKEIAYVLGISQSSIRQYKHRIRTKIDNEEDQNIDHFLDSI